MWVSDVEIAWRSTPVERLESKEQIRDSYVLEQRSILEDNAQIAIHILIFARSSLLPFV